MKQAEDNKTIDLVDQVASVLAPEPKRGRGRPRLDSSLSSADRMRAMRERKRLQGLGQITITLPLELLAALDDFIKFKDTNKDDVIVRLLKAQLFRKR